MNDEPTLKVTARTKVLKYAEGVDPKTGTPFDIVEQEVVLQGAEALAFLAQLGGDINGTNNSGS